MRDVNERRHRETRRHLRRTRRLSTWLLGGLAVLILLVVVMGMSFMS